MACRHTTKEEIEKEIALLNENFPRFSKENDSWNYYDYEELFVLEFGNIGKEHMAKSRISSINNQGLENSLKFFDDWFGNWYEKLKISGTEFDVNMLKEKIISLYHEFLINELNENKLFQLIKKMKQEGRINTDVSFLD